METDDTKMQREIRDQIRKLESVLSDIKLERRARLGVLSTDRATLRSQINRIRETLRRLLNEDSTLAERIRTLFREQGITISSILTSIGNSDLDSYACTHRRLGKYTGAASQAT